MCGVCEVTQTCDVMSLSHSFYLLFMTFSTLCSSLHFRYIFGFFSVFFFPLQTFFRSCERTQRDSNEEKSEVC